MLQFEWQGLAVTEASSLKVTSLQLLLTPSLFLKNEGWTTSSRATVGAGNKSSVPASSSMSIYNYYRHRDGQHVGLPQHRP